MEEKTYLFENQASEKKYEPIAKGDYEVFVEQQPTFTTTKNGKHKVSISMVIRDDIPSNPEKYRKWHIFEDIWLDEDNNPTNIYTLRGLIATQLEKGQSVELTLSKALNMLHGAKFKVRVDYKADQNYDTIQTRKYYTSDYKDKELEQPQKVILSDVDDSDLPF